MSSMGHTSAYDRFLASMTMDLEKWREGIGYDVDLLGELEEPELVQVIAKLASGSDWRDVEALAAIAGLESIDAARRAKEVLREKAKSNDQAGLRAAEA